MLSFKLMVELELRSERLGQQAQATVCSVSSSKSCLYIVPCHHPPFGQLVGLFLIQPKSQYIGNRSSKGV